MELVQRFRLWYYTQPLALRAILTINVVLYVLWQFVFRHIDITAEFVNNFLALWPALPGIVFHPWQLLTYSFLHTMTGLDGFLHILFNMLWLVWVGREFEYSDGSNRFLAVVILAAIGGALMSIFAGVIFQGNISIVGASASVLGIMAAVSIYYPQRSIGLMFLGNIRLQYLVIGFLILDLLFMGDSNTAIAAHLGGALTGFLFAKGEQAGLDLHTWAGIFFPSRQKKAKPFKAEGSPVQRFESWLEHRKRQKNGTSATIHTLPIRKRDDDRVAEPKPQNEQDLDLLLDKINEHGIDSLTSEERLFLDNESRK